MSNGNVTGWTGWVVFAAALMVIEGALQVLYGLGAIFRGQWFAYANGTAYVINVQAWGWWMLLIGVLLVIAGVSLWSGNVFGRVIGAFFAVISAVFNLSVIAVAPVWAIIGLIIDLAVLYAIVAHGNEMKKLMSG